MGASGGAGSDVGTKSVGKMLMARHFLIGQFELKIVLCIDQIYLDIPKLFK